MLFVRGERAVVVAVLVGVLTGVGSLASGASMPLPSVGGASLAQVAALKGIAPSDMQDRAAKQTGQLVSTGGRAVRGGLIAAPTPAVLAMCALVSGLSFIRPRRD